MQKTITKHIAARTEKLEIIGGRNDFMLMDENFRASRSRSKNPMDKCGFCKHAFENGEMMGLIMIKGKRNRLSCCACWDKYELT